MVPDVREIAGDGYILWGANWSLFSAKVRPYLIKKGIDYVELNPSHPHFAQTVLPKVGHFTVPVLETPDGDVIADSTEIMEYLEERYPALPMLPEDKALAAIARLIHSYGSEGLIKPAMYLRWNTTYENRLWVRDEFRRSSVAPEQGDEFAVAMRASLPWLGIGLDHDVDVAVESSTNRLYDILQAHFLAYPYILGGVPSLADYGMMGALYAHHGRDIASSTALKERAPALYRWIETMGRAPIVDPEVWHVAPEYFAIDALPETLKALLQLIADDYVPEVHATLDQYDALIAAQAAGAGDVVDAEGVKRNHQVLGEIEHVQGGATIRRVALLDNVSHHLRWQALVEGMSASERALFSQILGEIGALELLDRRLSRPMRREDGAYVLA
ncbi:MAG: glutathione S-transferase family protein [Planctomycetota bacterium]|jgi:glutathione S-transferase